MVYATDIDRYKKYVSLIESEMSGGRTLRKSKRREPKEIKRDNSLINNNSDEITWIGTAVLPYCHGTTEELQKILKQHRIKVYYKTTNTFRNTFVYLQEKLSFMSTVNCVFKLR
ncbi:hypothetical protein MS3_00000727 [Schistosoma haematobium]|uniref:Uncharacterized protein n=1 Tax=Schistosoma haematobium TaxID=6185 RepID=A0A922LF61_SCHHA|nr:hypothetical protein MS3_00000727 [Schistosoma haematobium]KAH9580785.1 hypothetical protein MS3_00000727 [Schistosoma haematobium]